jgi:hypothetical protein
VNSRLFCTCRKWSVAIPEDSILHWTISERLPCCPFRRWWNAWKHRSLTQTQFRHGDVGATMLAVDGDGHIYAVDPVGNLWCGRWVVAPGRPAQITMEWKQVPGPPITYQ